MLEIFQGIIYDSNADGKNGCLSISFNPPAHSHLFKRRCIHNGSSAYVTFMWHSSELLSEIWPEWRERHFPLCCLWASSRWFVDIIPALIAGLVCLVLQLLGLFLCSLKPPPLTDILASQGYSSLGADGIDSGQFVPDWHTWRENNNLSQSYLPLRAIQSHRFTYIA